ncbi:bacterial NAD-glutamate dehydrogenase family protein [Asticcacaulis biprosthecium C19]|uniref:Bacterial NAD-glutamate dehydrogenase family protein n=1 Tax=Asticcacaulis biprosthecium C19 TaxID=715226 RepID=F4QJQ0_9CAUL|nr:NAD-glutamate dehydrogenase [Asticcacaulis biprosthecium]EGF92001.1 bacterial NAD-glutamate dehydrogenase family protein [Asticcacaulis biprosthecium C19]
MDELTTAGASGDTLHTVKDALTRGFVSATGHRDFLRLPDAEKVFLAQILEDFDPEELPGLDTASLNAIIAGFWSFGDSRAHGTETLRRIRPVTTSAGEGTAYDLIEIVQSDSPFIVETVMGELIDQGVSIRSMFHPVVTAARDGNGRRAATGTATKESMMLIVIERQSADRHKAILSGIDASLHDLKLAVLDFPRMQKLLAEEIATLAKLRDDKTIKVDDAVLAENLAFLHWVDENHFVFLGARGYTYPRSDDGAYVQEQPMNQLQEGFGVLRDPNRLILRRSSEPAVLSAQILHQLENSEPVTVAKANIKSRIHRRVYMDYVGIKRYGADGKPAGEVRFVGLFTSEAYDRPAFEVPLVRRKAQHVLHEASVMGLQGGYNEKRLKNIVETYPRDELFQMTEDELLRTARGILHLSDRPRVKLFTRKDPFDRFISVMLYIPREIYQSQMQIKAGEILAAAYLGRVSASYPYINDSMLSCIHYIIGVTPGDHFDPDIADLEADIENITRSWPQKLVALVEDSDITQRTSLPTGLTWAGLNWDDWAAAFPVGYQERFDLPEAVIDTAYLAGLSPEAPVNVRAYQRLEDLESIFCFKLYTRADRAIPLSDILPVLDQMGLKTLEEYGFNVKSWNLGCLWVHEFIIQFAQGARADFADFAREFQQTILALWYRKTESDGFNALTINGASWREIALLRALCRYRVQSGLDPSPEVQQTALRENPDVAEALLHLFNLKFSPDLKDIKQREPLVTEAGAQIEALLQKVASLDHDRVLRRLYLLLNATRRTNYFQTDDKGQPKTYISFKVASRELADLPEPKPYREIFVWSPRVEGVHLRFGPVARGGLRWSDRKEDFRTEVLGLVKAQQVKNAVIVPVGSKGGFFPKFLPRPGSSNATPDTIRNEGIKAYKVFLSGLLDLTDNLDAKGKIVPPPQVVAWDDPDPYLVVAADKGTATFSDIANGVAGDYGFWLGDAFASGGSVGYDHKAMGITARGAWEAVKRHFRELGKDIQSEDFTVAGVGDMSGDVFGNGMLLSPHIKLVAAFDHRDIFLDPNPDTARSFAERGRVFALPRSSWQDYDKALISQGGGVFSRGQKSIPLSPEVKAMLDLTADTVTPFELMNAILKARVELLYFGGIGTYVKSPAQSHIDVGDKANDALRIDGSEVRAKVIGEGANLALTQAGRIACAEAGVRMNTDAIDNSAGVDCSDHEVNIKILLGQLTATGRMTLEARNKLLAEMTDEVASHVLKHNYDQTLALTLQEATAADDNANAQAFMTALEKRGRLDRKVEGLPSNSALEVRRGQGRGLTRPELAVVMAYGKLVLFDDIVASGAPDDADLEPVLIDYFPDALHGYAADIRKHRLHREIIATVLANDIVNVTGPSFPTRVMKGAGVDAEAFVFAFAAARKLFGIQALWAEVSALDAKVPAAAQTGLYRDLSGFIRRQTYWIARRFSQTPGPLATRIKPYADGMAQVLAQGSAVLSETVKARLEARVTELTGQGAPEDLARRIALLGVFHHVVDVIDLALGPKKPLDKTVELYFLTGDRFGFDRLTEGAGSLTSADPWDRMATRRLIEDVLIEQKAVVKAMMSRMSPLETPQQIIETWEGENAGMVQSLQSMIADMQTGGWSFAKLTIVNAVLREWVGKL